jgi:hypothetical protein
MTHISLKGVFFEWTFAGFNAGCTVSSRSNRRGSQPAVPPYQKKEGDEYTVSKENDPCTNTTEFHLSQNHQI